MSIPDPRRDDAMRHAREIAHRFATTAALAAAVNEAKGTAYTADGFRCSYARFRKAAGGPTLEALLGKGPASDFADEDTPVVASLYPALHEPVNVTVSVGAGFDADPRRLDKAVADAIKSAQPEPAPINITAPSSSISDLQSCLQWGTSLERQAVEAFAQYGTLAEAAESMGMTVRLLRGLLSDLQRKAASHGWSPGHSMTKSVPDGFHVKGVSTYYDADGNLKGQWVKSNKDQDARIADMLDAIQGMAEPFRAAASPVDSPLHCTDDLLCIYPFGDPHFGMYAWAQETGEDFDLQIAEDDLVAAVDHLVESAPAAKEAIVVSLGDALHVDGKANQTTGGTPQDVDTRWSKVFGVVVRAIRRCVDRALTKHEIVRVICVTGNHDEMLSLVLAHCLAQFYEREPRVIVDMSPSKFFWHRFGRCLFGFHHGDKVAKDKLPGVMACDRKEDWGQTDYRYWYIGHFHHEQVKEYPGVTVESFRTLAAKDQYHASHGYRALRDMKVDIWHREFGNVARHIVGIRQMRAKRAGS